MLYKNVDTSFFRFVTMTIHGFDGQMDGRTDSILMTIPCVALGLHAVAR